MNKKNLKPRLTKLENTFSESRPSSINKVTWDFNFVVNNLSIIFLDGEKLIITYLDGKSRLRPFRPHNNRKYPTQNDESYN